jgi:hypothetical protein
MVGRPVTTTDTGEYRLFGLPPGRYYVVASRPKRGTLAASSSAGSVPTYFPGAFNLSGARPVSVRSGDVVNASFTLLTGALASLSGWVSRDCGNEWKQAYVVAQSQQALPERSAPIRPDGTFQMSGLSAGDWVIDARLPSPPGQDRKLCRATVQIADGVDASGVALNPLSQIKVRGRVVGDVGPLPDFEIVADTVDVLKLPGSSSSNVQNSRFSLAVFPGRSTFRLRSHSQVYWTLVAVRFRGKDVTDRGVELGPNDAVDDLEIEVTNKITVISGRATRRTASETAPTVMAFPSDPGKWGLSRYVGITRANPDGTFTIRYLPPGDYRVVAVEQFSSGEWADENSLKALAARATIVRLDDGASQQIEVPVTIR